MSSTLGAMLKRLDPSLRIQLYEMNEEFGREASFALHNAGTGHAGICELSYTPDRGADGEVVVKKAIENDPALIPRAEIIRDKGTDRQRFFRGEVDKYSWVDHGSSHGLSDLLAAFLWAQVESAASIGKSRRRIWETYDRSFRGVVEGRFRLPCVPDHCEQSHHMYYLMTRSLDERTALIRFLKDRGVHSVFHYAPLHLSEMGRAVGRHDGCPVAERTGDTLVRLPFYNALEPADQQRVIDAVLGFVNA